MRMMRRTVLVAFAAALSCTSPTATSTTWEAVLEGQPEFPEVTGSAVAETSATSTTVTATIAGATAGGVHPWHIHFGTCDDDRGIVGAADAYPPLEIGAGGSATATATVGVVLQHGEQYFVNVHAAPDDLATIVACGALVRR